MKSFLNSSLWVFLFICFLSNDIFAKNKHIFLCIDSMLSEKKRTGTDPTKLVYSYINGQKTECMTEHELRSLLSREKFKKTDNAIQNKQKKTLEQNAVFRGEKNLQNADLCGLDLQGIDLSGADLTGAQLQSVDLRNANLRNSKLCGANLRNAYCKSTDFTGADFSNADLSSTFFIHSRLKNTKGLTMDNLRNVSTLYTSIIDSTTLEVLETHLKSKFIKPRGTWVPVNFDNTYE